MCHFSSYLRSTILLLLFLTQYHFYGQTIPANYYVLTKRADSLFQARDYNASSQVYSQAFKTMGWKGLIEDRYRAACAWALAGNQDSSFFNLERIASRVGFSDYQRVTTDENLNSLHNSLRWNSLIQKIKANQDSIFIAEEKLDKKLIAELDSMAKEDQNMRNHVKNANEWTDILNYPKLKRIFNSYGFPSYDIVGVKGSHNFWLLVQHQDMHPAFQDSVLSAMKIQVEKGKASWKDYAYLVDRVKCNSGQLQIYGTQVTWVADVPEPKPVIEPEKLDERRKSVGLNDEEEYLKFMKARHDAFNK